MVRLAGSDRFATFDRAFSLASGIKNVPVRNAMVTEMPRAWSELSAEEKRWVLSLLRRGGIEAARELLASLPQKPSSKDG